MNSRLSGSVSLFYSFTLCLLIAQPAASQTLTAGDPGANVNIVGPTPDPNDIRDFGLKQQNEPSCAVRPGDSACIICGFNDYRTVDQPLIADAWQGVAMSCDAGTTWTSRVAPGHALHPSPIGTEFAADPRMIALPGMAIFNFIGGDRDEDSGVLAIQHWLEVNKEDADFYEPGRDTIIADTGSSGRFIDKPDATALLDKPGNQGIISLSTVMENPELGTITRDFPTGKLFVAYAVFTGSQSVKVLVKESSDWGKTWTNQTTKLSEDQNLVSGISLTAMGDSVLAVWRRAGDVNDFDSIMYAYTNNRGRKWTKAKVLADICSFDQISASSPTAVTFRTNDFPWAANDGENFYVFYSDRNYDGNSDCSLGRPRIVVHHASSGTGLGNSSPNAIDDSDDGDPATTEDAGGSFQFMPAAFGANGKVQVAWYDTRREGDLPLGFFLDANSNLVAVDGDAIPVIADYTTSTFNVSRKVDVYTARIQSDGNGGIVKSAPERVSQFRIAANIIEDAGDSDKVETIALEGEALFANPKLYASGTLPFLGDYIAVAAQQFRYDNDGKVISNATPNDDLSENNTDFFVAWTDNREVRGNIFPDDLDAPTPYTPPQNNEAPEEAPATGDTSDVPTEDIDDAATAPLLADIADEGVDLAGVTRTTEGIEDPFDQTPLTCTPQVLVEDKTRDANIYGARIRDRVRLTAPTPTKPLTNLQRAFPIAISNANNDPQTYLLRIRNQPDDAPGLGRASFRQLPAVPPFDQNVPPPVVWEEITVPPKSTLARTAFFVSNISSATTGVQVFADGCDESDFESPNVPNYGPYVGTCTAITSVTLGGEGPSGQLQQPDYQSTACLIEVPDPTDPGSTILVPNPDCTDDVLAAELHNPELINPELINPELINPELINPELINPELINPELINPELINPELINLGFANPELINPELINPELINPELINPELINPELINPELINSTVGDGLTWVDYTYAVRNTGNVTTSFNADIEISGPSLDKVDSQLIAWTMYITPTSVDCNYRPQVEKRVLATVNNPDEMLSIAKIEEPFNGDVSAIAIPGQRLFFTRRVFGALEDLEQIQVGAFTSASQAANCSQEDLPEFEVDPITGEILVDPVTGNPTPYTRDYFCQVSLADERERILLDTQPPTFNAPDNSVVPSPFLAADRPGGACVDLVGLGIVSAVDNGEPVENITCTDATGQPICVGNEPGQSIPFTPLDMNGEPVGAPVSCTAIDDAGNVAQANLFIDVRDTGDPLFTAFPTSISVNADADGFASLDFQDGVGIEVADLDNIDPVVNFSCVADTAEMQGPGDPLPTDSISIDCTVSDTSGNTTTQSFVVVVNDVIPPVFDADPAMTGALPDVTVPATDSGGVSNPYTLPTATDTTGEAASVTCTPPPSDTFVLGSTPVECKATDIAGNETIASFNVIITDAVPPEIFVPDDFVVDPQDAGGAVVDYEVTASDNIDPNPAIDCSPASGTLFPMGETTVSCTATDSEGNESTDSFVVTVGYADGFGIDPKKLNVRRGSSNPLSWGWIGADGSILDTSNDPQILEFFVCGEPMPMFTLAGDPGSSYFRIKVDNSWEYNWQSDDGAGGALLNLPEFYCVRVTSGLTGDQLFSPDIKVR